MSDPAPWELMSDIQAITITCDRHASPTRATWWLTCRECNHTLALCASHRAVLDGRDTYRITRTGLLRRRRLVLNVDECDNCGTLITAPAWRALFALTPIRWEA